jgi:hypothetical protein
MAKAKPEATTARIRYSQALKLASEYLGDPEFVERDILKGLAAREISWWCERFEAPSQYSGPGRGDPNFWKTDHLCTRDGILTPRGLRTKGDSAKRRDGAAAYGIELDRNALVRLLPPDAPRATLPARKKRKASQVDRVLRALRDPDFPGGVADDIPTNVIHPKVVKYLQLETKRLGLSDPSWDSVDRALKIIRSAAASG